MRKILLFCALFVVMGCASAYGDVAINAANFPDDNFRSYVSSICDRNNDGVLSEAEIAEVKWITVRNYYHYDEKITTLKGIEYFTALTNLDCNSNQLTTLDVSRNIALKYLDCSGNQLTALNVSNNTALTRLECLGNDLTTLDLSNNTALTHLLCSSNQLTTLDLSNNTALTELECLGNNLTTLDLSNNIALTHLLCSRNHLKALDLSNNIALIYLECLSNDLTTLDLNNNTALTNLYCISQDINGLRITTTTNTTYPYQLNFSDYMTSDKIAGISNVNAYDSSNSSIQLNYTNGIAQFTSRPSKVTYDYNTGYSGIGGTMDVTISDNTSLDEPLTGGDTAGGDTAGGDTAGTDETTTSEDVTAGNLAVIELDDYSFISGGEDFGIPGHSFAIRIPFDVYFEGQRLTVSRDKNVSTGEFSGANYLGSGANKFYFEARPYFYFLEDNTEETTLISDYISARIEFDYDANGYPYLRLIGTAYSAFQVLVENLSLHLDKNTNETSTPGWIDGVSPDYHLYQFSRNGEVVLEVSGDISSEDNASGDLSISDPITITTDTLPDARVNNSYSYELSATGESNDSVTWTAEGLPEGMYLDGDTITGTPSRSGTYEIEIKAEGANTVAEKVLTLTVSDNTLGGDVGTDIGTDVGFDNSSDDRPVSGTYNNHVYTVFTNAMKWDEAKSYCESLGGHLATITSLEEYNFIVGLVSRNDDSSYWLGASDEEQEGSWKWLTGEAFSFERWFSGEPNNQGGNEHYLLMSSNNGLWGWNDATNNDYDVYYFICEWDPVEVEAAPVTSEFEQLIESPDEYFREKEFYGGLPEPVDLSHLQNNIPESIRGVTLAADESKYDLRDYNRITPIKNQLEYGTCWAFSALASMESNYLKNHPNSNIDLSELHMAWFAFNDTRPGYSFPTRNIELKDKPEYFSLAQGGWPSMAIAMLSRMSAPANESDMLYGYNTAGSIHNYNQNPDNYSHPLRLKEAITLGKITSENRSLVKNLIKEYGAVQITYDHNEKKRMENPGQATNNAFFMQSNSASGHTVNIIGWDDNYPVNNFINTTPTSPGAWLIKNSWGTSAHDQGCFWMSYEQNIGDATIFIAGDSISGLKHYGYDMLGSMQDIHYAAGHQWAANVFKAERDEKILEVAFYTRDYDMPYEIYINNLGTKYPQGPGSVYGRTPDLSNTMKYPGYHSLSLNSPIEIKSGEYFSVIVKVSEGRNRKGYLSVVEGQYQTIGGVYVNNMVVVNENESYFASADVPSSNFDWIDGKRFVVQEDKYKVGYNACIKAFTVPVEIPEPVKNQETSSSSSGGSGGCNMSFSGIMLIACVILFRKK